jgi:predicted O-methyltransferase YrrM
MDDPFSGAYPWDYLKPENSDRPAILKSLIEPFIGGKETVVDMLCGFSPLSRFLLEKDCRVMGFDKSPEAIDYCIRAYPLGTYSVADDATVGIPERVDVLLHIGIAPGTDPWGLESRTEVETSIRTIRETLPRLVVLESALDYADGYYALKSLVENLRAYRLQKEIVYEFHPTERSINPAAATTCRRILSIYRKERNFCSLSDETLARFFADLNPGSQAESISDLNLGFGFLYYAMGRIIRPKLAVVLGSQMGFSAISIALSIRDNANSGKLILVDAGYSDSVDGTHQGMGGIGFWKDPERVTKVFNRFEVGDIMEVRVMRTSDFAQSYTAAKMPPLDLLLIDADHSYEGFRYDFETYSKFLSNTGLILCHDTEVMDDGSGPYPFGVGRYLRNVIQRNRRYQAISLPIWPGLGIVSKAGTAESRLKELAGWLPASWPPSASPFIRTVYGLLPLPRRFRQRVESSYARRFSYGSRIRWRRRMYRLMAKNASRISNLIPGAVRDLVPHRIKRALYRNRDE